MRIQLVLGEKALTAPRAQIGARVSLYRGVVSTDVLSIALLALPSDTPEPFHTYLSCDMSAKECVAQT